MTPPRSRGGWGSSDWSTWEEPPGRPIPVEGGLTARSTRGGIGEQWWSRRFIAVLESFALGGRLTRGRLYARKGQVISLEVEPGLVRASVQGSRVTPYQVRIGLPRFSELIWAKVEVVLAEQAIHSARLLAGEFPPELEPVFAGVGAPLFPARLSDLTLECSCPDHMVPCKHLAAVFYLLAERFDDDPFLILRWRGRPRDVLLRRLRELRGDEYLADDEIARLGAAGPDGLLPTALTAGLALTGAEPVAAASAATEALDFWTAAPPPPLPAHPLLPVDLVLRLLPTPGAELGGSRLLAHLGPIYDQLAEATPETHRGPRHGNLGP